MAVKQLKFVKSNGKTASGIYEYITRQGDHQDNSDRCLVTGHAHLPSFSNENAEHFWKMADKYERANAKRCTHIVVALPRELGIEDQASLMNDFVKRNFKGCPLSWAIHEGYNQHNPHAHLQVCERRIETVRESEFSEKRFFKRNGVKKDRNLNHKSFCSHLYRQYAGSINHHLELAGSEERLNTEPQIKEFLEMSFSEKVQQHMDRQMAELEEKHKKELAEKLKNLKQDKEKEYVWQREEFRRDESTIDNNRKTNAVDAGKGEETGKQSRSLFRNAERDSERELNSPTTEPEDNQSTPGITSFLINLFTKRNQSGGSENSQSDRRIERGAEEWTNPRRLSKITQKIYKSIVNLWFYLFKKDALKKLDNKSILFDINSEIIPNFKELELTETQKFNQIEKNCLSQSTNIIKETNNTGKLKF